MDSVDEARILAKSTLHGRHNKMIPVNIFNTKQYGSSEDERSEHYKEIEELHKTLLKRITRFRGMKVVQPKTKIRYNTQYCNKTLCALFDICQIRCKMKLPVACEEIIEADSIFLQKYRNEVLQKLKILESENVSG